MSTDYFLLLLLCSMCFHRYAVGVLSYAHGMQAYTHLTYSESAHISV